MDDSELNDLKRRTKALEDRTASNETAFNDYRISIAEWHVKARSDLDHMSAGCKQRKIDCGSCLFAKVDKVASDIGDLKIIIARHAVIIGLAAAVSAIVASAVMKYIL